MQDDTMHGYTKGQLEAIYSAPSDPEAVRRTIIPELAGLAEADLERVEDARIVRDVFPGQDMDQLPAALRFRKLGNQLAPALERAGAVARRGRDGETDWKVISVFWPVEQDPEPFQLVYVDRLHSSGEVVSVCCDHRVVADLTHSQCLLPARQFAPDGSSLDA
jgi:hypothetical protein